MENRIDATLEELLAKYSNDELDAILENPDTIPDGLYLDDIESEFWRREENGEGWEIMTLPVDVVKREFIPLLTKIRETADEETRGKIDGCFYWINTALAEHTYIQ